MQGLKPTVIASPIGGTTEVVPCYKTHKFKTLRGAFSFRAETNIDAFAPGSKGEDSESRPAHRLS
jgi:hypothetical protein